MLYKRVRSDIKSRSTSANRPKRATMTLVCRVCLPLKRMVSFNGDKTNVAFYQGIHDVDDLAKASTSRGSSLTISLSVQVAHPQ